VTIAEQIGFRVKKLRDERGWTQATLAEKADVSQSTIGGIEAGIQMPGTGLLSVLAGLFHVDLGYFYRAQENPFDQILMRAEEVSTDLAETLRAFSERCFRYREVEQAANFQVTVAPAYDPPARSTDIFTYTERIAEDARRRLNLGDRPTCDLPEILEGDGLRVMGVDAGPYLDGLFLFAEGEGGFALVNTSRPHERQLFTLAHEYGHFLVHRGLGHQLDYDVNAVPAKGDRVEMTANSFAAAFLMPRSAIESWWLKKGRDNLAEIIGLRRSLGVSYRALGWRLVSLGLISKPMRERLKDREDEFKYYEEILYGKSEGPCVRVPEFSDRQRLLAFVAFQTGEVTVSKLAEWLDTDLVSADRIARALRGEMEPSVPVAH